MPTTNLFSLALTSSKTFWKCHGDFTCERMGDIRPICLLSEILYGGSPLSYTVFAVDSDTDKDKRCAGPQCYHQCRCRCRWRCCRRCRPHRLNRSSGILLHQQEKATCLGPTRTDTDKPADDFHLSVQWYHRGIRPHSECTKCYK